MIFSILGRVCCTSLIIQSTAAEFSNFYNGKIDETKNMMEDEKKYTMIYFPLRVADIVKMKSL
jgi:hypothetical protein